METLTGIHSHRNKQRERGWAEHDPRSDYGRVRFIVSLKADMCSMVR